MIKSMTGFGRGEWQQEGKRIGAEVRSFNHRFLDVSLHLPRKLAPLEPRVRNLVKGRLSRGRIEISIQVDSASVGEQRLELDLGLAREYYQVLQSLQANLGIPGEIRLETLASFREIFARKEVETDLEKEWAALESALDGAIQDLEGMRREEGLALRQELLNRIAGLATLVDAVAAAAPGALEGARMRLAERVKELSGGIVLDEGRLAQEVAYLAERSDITEELVRLRSHLAQFRELLDRDEPVGRKLDFLLQEINREANTTGSKANDAEISQSVVTLKSELEKMREQVQNVE